MTQIKDALLDFNPWWKREFKVDYKERDIFSKIQKFVKLPQILAFTGLRRVGKTTLMLKIAEDKVKAGLDQKNVIYFSFDEFKSASLREILREYESLMEKDLLKEDYLLLLDEIQKVEGWEDQLKRIYDSFKENIKILISGSESLFMRKKAKATLAGRLFEFKVEMLTFREYLGFRGVNLKPRGIYEKELIKLFQEFILSLGFPELCGISDREIITKYVKESIIDKIIYKDIPALFRVDDVSQLESLNNIFMENPGQITEISELAKELKVSRQTLSNYLRYLEDSFLLRKLYNFSKNRRKIERKLKKYYPMMISPHLLFKTDDFSRSKIFEWLAVSQLKAEYFWRDPYKNEVDIILAEGDKIIPLEIKYGKIETEGVRKFMESFNISRALILTPNREDVIKIKEKTIMIRPLYKYLLEGI